MSLQKKRFVIAGGSGFLGISLAKQLVDTGAEVSILARHRPSVDVGSFALWDGLSVASWAECLNGSDGIINLAGRSVDCIKTPAHCDQILRSRVDSTRALGRAMRTIAKPPPVWIQMSTAHIYGDPPSQVCDETSSLGYGLAPFVGQAWEAEFAAARLPVQRPVVLRTSFVIGNDLGAGSGAMARLRLVTKLGLGGRIGSGRQGMSWIHQRDLNRIIVSALGEPRFQGLYVASAPNPVSQIEFMRALRAAMGIKLGLPATEWMVRAGARWLLKSDPNLALYGRYVVPKRLLEDGFEFEFPRLKQALESLESGRDRRRPVRLTAMGQPTETTGAKSL